MVNIAQALHPNKPERHHKDVTSVAASVHSFDNKDDLPVITYKQPGVAHFDPILREGVEAATAPKSFSTIVDGAQCQAAQSQGNSQMSVVWIDSMHGTHSDSANSDRFLMDTTNGICLRQMREAAAPVQQLLQPITKLEEMRNELKKLLQETSVFIDSLTTLEEIFVVNTALCAIRPKVTALRAREAMKISNGLVPTAEEPNKTNVKQQRRFFSTSLPPAACSKTVELGAPKDST